MPDSPVITTCRLHLRPFDLADADDVQAFAEDREIASTTLLIPHPYPKGAAAEWIRGQKEGRDEGWALDLAITERSGGRLVGAINLAIEQEHGRAEMGYWIGRPFWNRGFATEAARAVVEHGFRQLSLHRIFAHHMARNPASGRVLEKIGMKCEGTLRQHVRKWDAFEDVVTYAILRSEYEETPGRAEAVKRKRKKRPQVRARRA